MWWSEWSLDLVKIIIFGYCFLKETDIYKIYENVKDVKFQEFICKVCVKNVKNGKFRDSSAKFLKKIEKIEVCGPICKNKSLGRCQKWKKFKSYLQKFDKKCEKEKSKGVFENFDKMWKVRRLSCINP